MELAPQEKSRAWWKGAFKGVLSAIPQGIVIGAVASAILFFGIVPAAAALGFSLGPVFGTFIATATVGGSYTPLPMMVFNVALLAIGNAISGGSAAVAAYHQQKHNSMYEARITALEQERTPATAQEQSPMRSRAMDKILNDGPRHQHSHADTETQRDAAASTRIIH